MLQALAILLEGVIFERLVQRYPWFYAALKKLAIGLLCFLAVWILYAFTQ